MIYFVNDHIRQEIRVELARRNMKQTQLAEEIGRSRQQLSAVMQGQAGNLPDIWERIFDKLDLELIPVPKDKVSIVKKALVD